MSTVYTLWAANCPQEKNHQFCIPFSHTCLHSCSWTRTWIAEVKCREGGRLLQSHNKGFREQAVGKAEAQASSGDPHCIWGSRGRGQSTAR